MEIENEEKVGNLRFARFSQFTEVAKEAYTQAANMSAEVVPVTVFRQGQRYQVVGVMRLGVVSRILYADAAKKGASLDSIGSTSNRPEDPKHTTEIADYIKTNMSAKYVLGALTLNVQQELTVFTGPPGSDVQMGYLILPWTARISITDGQHRQKAIKQLLDEGLSADDKNSLGQQGIAVIITNETDIEQIHQDFADASKTKPLPPGLLAAYDTRNPANRVVLLLEKNCKLFKGRIDATSKSISKNSPMLFTANQIRSFVKEFVAGSWQLGNVEFERRAQLHLPTEEILNAEMAKAADYINRVTDAIPVLRAISELKGGIAAGKVAEFRGDEKSGGYVCLSASGLVILGKIGHELIINHEHDWQSFADRLGQIPWEKNAAMWQGNVVQPSKNKNGAPILKILQQQNLIRQAANNVRVAIGLAAEPEPAADLQRELAGSPSGDEQSAQATA